MNQMLKSATKFLVAIFIFFTGWVSSDAYKKYNNLQCEYGTAFVIRDFMEYLNKHRTWPRQGEINCNKAFTFINYNISIDTADRYEIMESINVVNEIWYTYPHYKKNMNDLYLLVLKIRNDSDITKSQESAQQVDAPELASPAR